MTSKLAIKDAPPHVQRAIDKADEDDRQWFQSHPTRHYRLRNIRMFEFQGNDDSDRLIDGASFRVISVRLGKTHERLAVILPDWLPNSGERDELPDSEIKRVLDYWFGKVKTMMGP